ncbi:MAG: hypothetical protein IT440_08880 [Phycisphaeraceae bacterium]|nr:hypothetical protein [Phycisphaeraceae bacterium]
MRMRLSLLAVFWLVPGLAALADPQHQVLYSTATSPGMQAIVVKLQDPATKAVPYDKLCADSRYYARIAPRQHTLEADNRLRDGAILGTKPMVFLTTPESLYGKNLVDVYLDIGYEAEDILRWQRDMAMVAILFRYPDHVDPTPILDGVLPEDWRNKVYVPTWDNVIAVFGRLAAQASIDPKKEGEFAPWNLTFTSEAQRQFVLSFPDEGLLRVKTAGYATLKQIGGADALYRNLLEKKLSIFEHFRGNGRTMNELIDPDGAKRTTGLYELIGPNAKVKDLPEVVVIDLGTLVMREQYTAVGK